MKEYKEYFEVLKEYTSSCYDVRLFPQALRLPRPGFCGWLLRIMNNKKGWTEVNTCDWLEQLVTKIEL